MPVARAIVARRVARSLLVAGGAGVGCGAVAAAVSGRAADARRRASNARSPPIRTIAAARLQRPIDVAGVGVAGERPNPEVAYECVEGNAAPVDRRDAADRARRQAPAPDRSGERDRRRRATPTWRASSPRSATTSGAPTSRSSPPTLRVQIADDVRALAQRARDAANARVDAGDVPQSDLTQSELALANSENDLSAARGEAAADARGAECAARPARRTRRSRSPTPLTGGAAAVAAGRARAGHARPTASSRCSTAASRSRRRRLSLAQGAARHRTSPRAARSRTTRSRSSGTAGA